VSTSNFATETQFRLTDTPAFSPGTRTYGDPGTGSALSASLLREKELLHELSVLAQRQDLMAEEFEHRLGNSLQMIVSLLSLQSLAASTPEVAAQLTIAAGRVAAFGRVHRRLHLHDRQKSIDFKLYLQSLCGDLADLMLQKNGGRSVFVTGTDIVLPTALGVPLGFLVSEAITNSVKYAHGDIIVGIEVLSDAVRLSIADEGPGLPAGFDPKNGKGLGMRLIHSLAKQIGGTLAFAPGRDGRGTRLTVTFTPAPAAPQPHGR
jgi:two-component sensor histidine kinase